MKKQKVTTYLVMDCNNKDGFHGRGVLHFTPALGKNKNAVVFEYNATFKNAEGIDSVENLDENLIVSPIKINLAYLNKKEIAKIENECYIFVSIEFGVIGEVKEILFDPIMNQINLILSKKFRKDLAIYLSSVAHQCVVQGMKYADSVQRKGEKKEV